MQQRSDATKQKTDAFSEKQFALTVSLCSTFVSLIPTVYAALISNSLTLFADTLRCTVEFAAIAIAWLIARHIRNQSARVYNYGFEKLEQLSNLAVAGAMLIAFATTSTSFVFRIINPQPVVNVTFGLIFAIFSVAGNVFVWLWNLRLLRQTSSAITHSQMRLFKMKTIASMVVVVSLLLAGVSNHIPWAVYFDPLGSLILGVLLLRSGYQMGFQSLSQILDHALDEHLQLEILRLLVKHDKNYTMLHSIRSRRAGKKNYVELFLGFNGQLSLEVVLKTIESIRQDIEANIENSEVIIIPQR